MGGERKKGRKKGRKKDKRAKKYDQHEKAALIELSITPALKCHTSITLARAFNILINISMTIFHNNFIQYKWL